jgi:hypothetical protein
MRLWKQPAQPLPVRVRPAGGETLVSYTVRLAQANDLDRPTILLRALGEPTTSWTQWMLSDDYDTALNEHALRRLEIFTGMPAARLRMSLPTLHRSDAPAATIPATRPYRCPDLRDHCDHCAAQLPGRPKIRVHNLPFPRICRRHRRWTDTGHYQPHQVSFADAPEIITAHHRYARLRGATPDHPWLHEQLRQATRIAQHWATSSYRLHPQLHARWAARGAALRPPCGPHDPTPVLVFPEAVAITEILCDLHWRRHVAMVNNNLHLARFYRRIAQRLGQPPVSATTGTFTLHDPLRDWIAAHRQQHAQIRADFWQRHHRSCTIETPFPEIRHFK